MREMARAGLSIMPALPEIRIGVRRDTGHALGRIYRLCSLVSPRG